MNNDLISRKTLLDALSNNMVVAKGVPKYEWTWVVRVKENIIRVIKELSAADTGPSKQEWISVKDDMPKERESIFARFYGTDKWRTGMFRTASDDVIACVEYEDGSRLVKVLHTISGEWHMSGIPGGGIVTHWMPLPEPPKEGE